MSASSGSAAQFAFIAGTSPYTWSGGERFAPVSETLTLNQDVVPSAGLTGFRGQINTHQRRGINAISGDIVIEPTYSLLGLLLPAMTGDGSNTYTLQNTLADGTADFGILVDRVGETFEYKDCKITRWTLAGEVGGLITLSMSIVGKTLTTGTTFPSLSLGTTDDEDDPYLFHECTFTMNSGTRQLDDFSLTVDQGGEAIFRNSQTMVCYREGVRSVNFSTASAFTSTEMSALYNQDEDGYQVTITIANDTNNEVITLDRFQPDRVDPSVAGPGEILLPLSGPVTADTSSGSEITWDHSAI